MASVGILLHALGQKGRKKREKGKRREKEEASPWGAAARGWEEGRNMAFLSQGGRGK